MIIGGYEPCTLSDYPGCVAAIVFTQGCNYRCPFCHNAVLLPLRGAREIEPAAVLAWLGARCGQLDAVVISGGEPALHADLAEFLRAIRRLGLRTKLDTNGSRPAVLRRLLDEGLLDFIAMDIKAPWSKYAQLTGCAVDVAPMQESVHLIASSGVAHLFRTTVVPSLLSADDLRSTREQVPASSPYRTQPFIARRAPAGADGAGSESATSSPAR